MHPTGPSWAAHRHYHLIVDPQLTLMSNGLCLLRGHGLDVEHGAQQVLDDLVLVLFARVLDLLDLLFGFLVCVFLGLLVTLRVL